MRKCEEQATQFCEAIRTLANNTKSLENLESYLSRHFSEWISKWANSPASLAEEMKEFAEMEI